MENELRAPRDGRVKDVHVTEGALVEAGRLLVVSSRTVNDVLVFPPTALAGGRADPGARPRGRAVRLAAPCRRPRARRRRPRRSPRGAGSATSRWPPALTAPPPRRSPSRSRSPWTSAPSSAAPSRRSQSARPPSTSSARCTSGGSGIHIASGRFVVEDLKIEGITSGRRPVLHRQADSGRHALEFAPAAVVQVRRQAARARHRVVDMTDWEMTVEKWGDRHNFVKFGQPSKKPRGADARSGPRSAIVHALRGQFSYIDHGSWTHRRPQPRHQGQPRRPASTAASGR